MIHYKIESNNPAAHYFDITVKISSPDPDGQVVRLPAWIPGSYMIRDFARNIIEIDAYCGAEKLILEQLDKSSWQVQPSRQPIAIKYRVYAWDLSVRSAHFDTTHGFFNGSSVFVEVVGQGDKSCEVLIVKPAHADCNNWRLATTLQRKNNESSEDEFSFGLFQAANYSELIDHPVEMGNFEQFDFQACSVRHDVILTGRYECDTDRLKSDLEKICEQHIGLFGQPAPMSRYMFLVMVVGDGYGGLEHRSSTSLLCSRRNLPQPGQKELTEEYRDFLGLCSHEYFHSWNVKRIKPAVYENPDLGREVYTPLLWAFEGITSYYDDLALLRSGCISRDDYLEILARMVTRVQRTAGRKLQSAAQSSFNAWTKFYNQDENASNAIISYYAKGSLIALCMDLKIRALTGDEKSLDDVMRMLWQNYLQSSAGIGDSDIQQIVCQLVDEDISDFLDRLIYQTEELPLSELLENLSVELEFQVSSSQDDKGGKVVTDPQASSLGTTIKELEGRLTVVSVKEDSAAQLAGMSAGDEIISINGIRASMQSYNAWLKLSQAGTAHTIMAFRRDELMSFDVILNEPEKDSAVLKIKDESNKSLLKWLQMDAG